MAEFSSHPLFGLTLTAAAYLFGLWLYQRTRFALFHPLPVAIALVCGFLLLTGTSYEDYNVGGSYLTTLLTPATVCLAVPLHEKMPEIQKRAGMILVSLSAGCATAVLSVWILCRVFGLPNALLHSLVPKSVTTAVAVEIAAALGGIRSVTVLAVLLAGMIGALFGPPLCRLFRIRDPISHGLAVGTASHALGTARIMATDRNAGAAGGLAIGICGLITAVLAPVLLRVLTAVW